MPLHIPPVGAAHVHAEHERVSSKWSYTTCLLLNSSGHDLSPVTAIHTAKPGGGGGTTGAHVSPGSLQVPLGVPSHVYATVLQVGGPESAAGGLASVGVHSLSVSVSGAMERDCVHGTPPQTFPAGIALAWVQVPVQASGGSNDEGFDAMSQIADDAVSVAGSAQEPAGASHPHAPHASGGDVRSAWPAM